MASSSVTSTSALFQRARVRSEPGSKLYFYLTETSTPASTYQDIDLSTAHSNPVVADADGYFDPIYLDASLGDYRYTLTDADDVIIEGPIDDVPSSSIIGGSFSGTLTGTSGAAVGTIAYQLVGSLVYLRAVNSISGTSNSTSMTMTGLPSEIIPSATRLGMCTYTSDDSGALISSISVSNSGVVTFFVHPTNSSLTAGGFTASGTKGLPASWFATYAL